MGGIVNELMSCHCESPHMVLVAAAKGYISVWMACVYLFAGRSLLRYLSDSSCRRVQSR